LRKSKSGVSDTTEIGMERYYTVRLCEESYNRVCRLIERDERNRSKTLNRARGNTKTAQRGSRIKPVKMDLIGVSGVSDTTETPHTGCGATASRTLETELRLTNVEGTWTIESLTQK